jgi:murine toxin
MSKIDDVQRGVQNYFNHLSGPNYVRLLDTPHVWGLPFGQGIMPRALERQAEFERAIVEIVQKSRYRCDLSSLNSPDPDWVRAILGAMDAALSTPMGRTQSTQFRFLFGQTPLSPVTAPPNYTDFKGALVRLVRTRSRFWERKPEIWMGRFYRLQEGILSGLHAKVFGDTILASDDTKMTWNHSKIIAVDGTEALVGGHNLNMDLFRSYPPVHDVSIVVHGPAAYGSQLFLNRMWECGTDLLAKEYLDVDKLSWINADSDRSRPTDPLSAPNAAAYVCDSQNRLVQMHKAAAQSTATIQPREQPQGGTGDLETLADLQKDVFEERIVYSEYDKFQDYKLATRMLAVGKYWTGPKDTDYQKASEVMKEQLIKGARNIIRMSQMDLISAWKKNWADHVVCQWIMDALLANPKLIVQVVVSPLDAGAGAEGDQYSFGSGAVRTTDLITYYMTHNAQTDAELDDRDGARAAALKRLRIAPLYFTDRLADKQPVEGRTYKWPDLSPEGYTATLKQPSLDEKPPKKGVIGSAALSVVGASGYIYSKVPSAPGNHAKITIIDNELYVVGSDNLYPGSLSEFNYLVEGGEAIEELLRSYWGPLWRYSSPHGCGEASVTDLTAAANSAADSAIAGDPAGYVRSDGIASVVYRGANKHIYELYLRNDVWAQFDMSATVAAPAAAGNPAGYVRADGTNAVVYRGENNHIYELYLEPGSWRYRDLSAISAAPDAFGDPAGYVRSDGTSAVVYCGQNNHVYELYLEAGATATWSHRDLSGNISAPIGSGDPVGYVRSDGSSAVVYRGNDADIHELYLEPEAYWCHRNLSKSTSAPAALGNPAGYVRSDKIDSVVYRGTDKHIYEMYLRNGVWAQFDMSATVAAPAAAGDPSGYAHSDGTNSVVYRAENNHIYELYLQPGTTWQIRNLSEIAGARVASGDPAGYVRLDGTNVVVYRGEDNHIYELPDRNLAGLGSVKVFHATGGVAVSHPETTLTVPEGYKILGGGARVNWSEPGNMLTASFPRDARTWVARSKDQVDASAANIDVWAIAIHDPQNNYQVEVFPNESASTNHPCAVATVPEGYVLTGGGACANWKTQGSLLTASYPDGATRWVAASKDHADKVEQASVTAYAIGIKAADTASRLVKQLFETHRFETRVFAATGGNANHPTAELAVDPGFVVVGGGAKANWTRQGSMLTACYPGSPGTWKAASKDHLVRYAEQCTITAYAIGARVK